MLSGVTNCDQLLQGNRLAVCVEDRGEDRTNLFKESECCTHLILYLIE